MAKKTKKNRRLQFHRGIRNKLVILYIAIVLAFLLLVGYIAYIDVARGEKYTRIVLDQQQYNSRTIPFKRGDIVDRNGTKLATSERIYNVILDAKVLLSKEENVEQTLSVLQKCFRISPQEVRKVLEENPSGSYHILKRGVTYKEAKVFREMDADNENYPHLAGIWLEDDYVRVYPYDTLASDVIGFTVSGNVGNCGIESSYNSILNGTDGRKYGYLDDVSSLEKTVKEPENGSTVVSTIDLQVQSIVEKHVKAFNDEHKNGTRKNEEGSKNTAVIVMNPQNGEILAMASYPNFNLNSPRDLSMYYDEEKIKAMGDTEKLDILNGLWNNFCVSSTYEPGSTMKPFTLCAGFDLGVLKGDEEYNCGGKLHVGDDDIHCVNRSGHGKQTLKVAFENSCNVALMKIGEEMGVDEMCRYQRLFGFGLYTGIDLPGEAQTSGLLYTADTMDPASLATNAFGQNINVTAVQLCAGFCSLINGGDYYEPHVVKEIQDANGSVTDSVDPVLVRKTVSADTSEIIKEYMLGVVEEGTAKNAQVEGYDVGGKTGTAEKHPRGQGNYLVSFIGYAPQETPQVMVYVAIDEPNVDVQANSGLATRMASAIMEEIFPYLGVEPSVKTEDTEKEE